MDVFISYSRRDKDIVQKLLDEFSRARRDVWVDWEDIPRASDWMQEIYQGIESSNVFVFVVSENSLKSAVCNEELAHAIELNKRIVPAIYQDITSAMMPTIAGEWFEKPWEQMARDNWRHLKTLNWIFINDPDHFQQEFNALNQTLDQDPEHLQAHTRYSLRSRDWEARGRDRGSLLQGAELEFAENWLNTSGKEPLPSDLQREFIQASRLAEDERHKEAQVQARRVRQLRTAATLFGLVGMLSVGATLFSIAATQSARQALTEAEEQRVTAEFAAQSAEQEVESAIALVAVAGTAQADANMQRLIAEEAARQSQKEALSAATQVSIVNAALTPVPVTLTAVAGEVERVSLLSDALNLLARAGSILTLDEGNTHDAILLILQSLKRGYLPQADAALQNALDRVRIEKRFVLAEGRPVTGLAYHVDGTHLYATVAGDSQIYRYDLISDALTTLATPFDDGPVDLRLALSTDSTYLAVFSPSRSDIAVYTDDELVMTLTGFENINSISFDPESLRLAAAMNQATIVWNLATGREIVTLLSGGTIAQYLYAEFLYIGQPWGQITIFNTDTWQAEREATLPVRNMLDFFDLPFGMPGSESLLVLDQFTPQLWGYTLDGSQLLSYAGGRSDNTDFGVTTLMVREASAGVGTNLVVYAINNDGTLRVWNVLGGLLFALNEFTGRPLLVSAPYEDATRLAIGDDQGGITLISLNLMIQHDSHHLHTSLMNDIAISPDGNRLATIDVDGGIVWWSLADNIPLRFISAGQTDVLVGDMIVIAPDNETLWLWTRSTRARGVENELQAWNMGTGQNINRFTNVPLSRDGQLSILPDGRLVAALADGGLGFINPDDGTVVERWSAPAPLISARVHQDGQFIAGISSSYRLFVWTADGELIMDYAEEMAPVSDVAYYRLAFSPDGSRLAFTGPDFVGLLDIATSQLIGRYEHLALSVDISPDGRWVASAGSDKLVNLWDVETGQLSRLLRRHSNVVSVVAFTPDGRTLISGGWDETVYFNPVTIEGLVLAACQRIPGDISTQTEVSLDILLELPTCAEFGTNMELAFNVTDTLSDLYAGLPPPDTMASFIDQYTLSEFTSGQEDVFTQLASDYDLDSEQMWWFFSEATWDLPVGLELLVDEGGAYEYLIEDAVSSFIFTADIQETGPNTIGCGIDFGENNSGFYRLLGEANGDVALLRFDTGMTEFVLEEYFEYDQSTQLTRPVRTVILVEDNVLYVELNKQVITDNTQLSGELYGVIAIVTQGDAGAECRFTNMALAGLDGDE